MDNEDTKSRDDGFDEAVADLLMLGHQQVGSYALGGTKSTMFTRALNSFVDSICDKHRTADLSEKELFELVDEALRAPHASELQSGQVEAEGGDAAQAELYTEGRIDEFKENADMTDEELARAKSALILPRPNS